MAEPVNVQAQHLNHCNTVTAQTLAELHVSPNNVTTVQNSPGIPFLWSNPEGNLNNTETLLPVAEQKLDLAQMCQMTKMSDQAV